VPREDDREAPDTKMENVAAPSWKNAANVPITGGATWTTYTLDAERGLLYVSGGNPAPDFVATMRPGDNLFANSVVVLDAKTGAYRRHFSMVPEDFHDWDVASAPLLTTTTGGQRLLAAAPKDGLLNGYDLENGKRLYTPRRSPRARTPTRR
jgi:alcohol dehydrogenase (cytochrome c)